MNLSPLIQQINKNRDSMLMRCQHMNFVKEVLVGKDYIRSQHT